MKICYPSKSRFSTEATDYRFKHEKVARDILSIYQISMKISQLETVDYFVVKFTHT